MDVAYTLKRAARLGRLGVRIARARGARRGPGGDAARRAVADSMGQLRGLPQKIGQILSLGELDTETPVFSPLTEATQSVPAPDSFRRIEAELDAPLERIFRRLDADATVASLAQVHRGELLDGRVVAVKVQYPDVRRSLDIDLAALGWLAAPVSRRQSGFKLAAYREEMRRALLRELDYRQEVAALRRFASRAPAIPGLVTPVPIDALCTPRLITMTWVDGEPFSATRDWAAGDRHQAALVLLRLFLHGCLVWHELHADPHPGNLRFRRGRDGVQVGMLDFGCIKALSSAECVGFWRLAMDGSGMSESDLFATYVAVGFNPTLLEPMARRLGTATRVLFEPFHADAPFDVRRWRVEARLAEALGEDRWNFRFAGPPTLLFFIRALAGVVQYVSRLGSVIDWRSELCGLPAPDAAATNVFADPIRSRRALVEPEAGINLMTARTLKLSVTRDGEQVVRLSFGAQAVANLDELVPEELREKLRRRNIDLVQIGRCSAERGHQPGELFSMQEGATSVRVWLE